MGRGTNSAEGIAIDEGTNAHGVRTVLHFEGNELIIEREQDMEAILDYVRQMRERNEGKGWGQGKEVGHIPALFYAPIIGEPDPVRRKQRIREFFRAHPAFCAYPPYLKR